MARTFAKALLSVCWLTLILAPVRARAETSDASEDLQDAQDPTAARVSLPFQYNLSGGVGGAERVQHLLNIQPVVPAPLTEHLGLLLRFILPVMSQPVGVTDRVWGLGDLSVTAWVVPKHKGAITVGFGPAALLRTATNEALGTGKWALGPSIVGVYRSKAVVLGALASQVWSFAGDEDRPRVSLLTIQPFLNINLPDQWFLVTAPLITASWYTAEQNSWTVPLGGGFGKLVRAGAVPINLTGQFYWNVARPDAAARYTIRLAATLLF